MIEGNKMTLGDFIVVCLRSRELSDAAQQAAEQSGDEWAKESASHKAGSTAMVCSLLVEKLKELGPVVHGAYIWRIPDGEDWTFEECQGCPEEHAAEIDRLKRAKVDPVAVEARLSELTGYPRARSFQVEFRPGIPGE